MTALDWSRVTDLFEALIAEPERKPALLEPEPAHIRQEVSRLVAAHEALERARPEAGSGRILRGRYQTQTLLGTGGSGEAWLCRDRESGDLVVMKVARHWEWFRADLKQRFQAEVEILRAFQHPGVIRVLDSGETEEGAPFLVMPFIDGLTLRALLDIGPLNPESAASILEQLGEAIAAAHQANVTHRDIKPENIMVQAHAEGSSRVFLIDFGIALFADLQQQCGTTTRFFGTTQYMAPEQLLGKPVPASDIYALALVAYEMLCGQSLLKADTPVGLYAEARQLKASRMDTRLAGSVRHLLLDALNPTPEKRPGNAAAFSRKLAAEIRHPVRRLPLRRSVLKIALAPAVAAVSGAAWLNHEYGPPEPAEKTVTYKAGQTFEQAGWSKAGHVDENVLVFDPLSGNVVGNSLTSAKQGGYVFPFSKRMQRAGLSRRWRAIFSIRPVHGDSGFAVCFREAGLRFVGTATVPDEGEPFVRLIQSYLPRLKDARAPMQPGAKRLMKFELSFDPARHEASLVVDGRLVLEGYAGTTEYLDLPGLSVGFGAFQSKIGEGVFGDIGFVMD
ncbi:MAG: serine/threonine protein kinase [Acidobacteriaceae bacterium]|nr:serine/threonine protein kinase [Acidobacteriaceae bacterium]